MNIAQPKPPLSEVALIAAEIRGRVPSGARIVFVSGNFNIMHPGHMRLLQFASQCGDFLVVGVLDHGHRGVTVPAETRLESVQAITWVGHAFLLRDTVDDIILALKPDIVVKGREFADQNNIESDLVRGYGGKLLFSSGEVRFSSVDLIEREYVETDFYAIRKPTDYPIRHGFKIRSLTDVFEDIKRLRVMVIGDLIIDEYINCDPLGMSQEDPTIVVTPIERKRFVGGAGIVAAHAHGIGATVKYVTVTGCDVAADYATGVFKEQGIESVLFQDDSRPTTVKRRYRAGGKTLLRVSELRQHAVSAEIAEKILDAVRADIATADLIMFSDFNYGCLPQPLVEAIGNLAKKHGVPMVADSQASSQMSDISRFRDMLLVTPTEREARLALHDGESGLVVVMQALQKKAAAENVVITLGAEGMLICARDKDDWMTDRLAAMNAAPKDPAGAGDSFFTCASLALRAGRSMWESAYLGSIAAACQVSRVGNTPLTPVDLIKEINLV